MKFDSPFIPIIVLMLNGYVLVLPGIILPSIVETELEYNETVVSLILFSGVITGCIGVFIYSWIAEHYSFKLSSQICFVNNFIASLAPVFFPRSIVAIALSRTFVGLASIISVSRSWTSKLNKDPIYMNYIIQGFGFSVILNLSTNAIVDLIFDTDEIGKWITVHAIGSGISLLTIIFLTANTFSEGKQESDELETISKPKLCVIRLFRTFTLNVLVAIIMFLAPYAITVDHEIRIYIISLLFLGFFTIGAIFAPLLQKKLVTKYQNEHIICATVLFGSMLLYSAFVTFSRYLSVACLLMTIGHTFLIISTALVVSELNEYTNQNAEWLNNYFVSERLGLAFGAILLIPLYIAEQYIVVGVIIFSLVLFSFGQKPRNLD